LELVLGADEVPRAWGSGYYGQAILPYSATNLTRISAGGDHGLGLLPEGQVVAWGANYSGQSSVPVSATNVVAITAGGAHTLALVSNGTLLSAAPLSAPALNTNTFSATLPTQSGRVYALQYKTSVTDTNWLALPLAPGLGTEATLVDPTATDPQRFYRVLQW
jgi:alpha-tubulin suppressor-like RCC1 family protein